MQPKFTQRNFGNFCTKILAFALILTATTQLSFAQEKQGVVKKPSQTGVDQKKAELDFIKASSVTSVGLAPIQNGAIQNNPTAGSPFSRAFCYNGAGPFQLNKQSLLNTTLTPIGAPVAFGFPGASAWVTTTNKLYVVDQASPFSLYTVDTLTGLRTLIANCTGVPQANFTGLTWDPSNNTMYGVSSSLSVSQIFTVNITTGVCTPIGAASGVCAGAIQVNAAPGGGSLFSVDIVADNLYKWNKTTGVATLIGPLGLNANFGQDGHFDISDGQYFWAAYNATAGQGQLRIIDTLTGGSTLVGAYAGQVQTLGIYPVPQAPCSGTPAPGNTVSSANPVCPTQSFTLAPQNLTIGSLVTYQWQTSPDGTTWTNVSPGGTGGNLTLTQTTATYYRVSVTCTGNTTFTTPLQVTMQPLFNCYCNSGATSTADEDIFNVTIGTLNNTSNCASIGPGPGSVKNRYSNYTTLPAGNIVSGNMPFSVQIGTCGGNFTNAVAIFIDYNHDGAFQVPAEVAYRSAAGTVGPHIESGFANIPTTALPGITLMRVVNVETGFPPSIQPCGTYTWGETEDYLVNIGPCVPITSVTVPATTNAECSGSATITANVGTASYPSYTWEYRITPTSPWQLASNGGLGGVISGATTASLVLSNIPSTLNGYQFRAVAQNPCTALDFSNPTTLVVGPLVARLNVTSPVTICTGSIQQLTLTNAAASATTTFSSGPLSIQIPDLVGPPASTPAVCDAGINHTIPVALPVGSVITRIDVKFNITHTYEGDLKIVLKGPNGKVLNLVYHKGGTGSGGANFVNTVISSAGTASIGTGVPPLTGLFRADASIGAGSFVDASGSGTTTFVPDVTTFGGIWGTPSGSWTLAINDAQEWAGDIGTLTSWSMDITYGFPAAGVWTQTSPATPPNTMFTDPAATIPYVTGSLANTIYVMPLATTPFTGNSATYCVVYSTPAPSCTSAPTCVTVNVTSPIGVLTVTPTSRAVCLGSSTTFTATTTAGGPLTYQWQRSIDGGITYTNITTGGTSQVLTVSNVTQLMNNYLYRVIVTAAPCGTVTSSSASLTVIPLPVVTISAPDLALTPGQTTTITASSSPAGVSYSWTRNGVTVTGATSSTLVVGIDQLGTYRATVTATNGCTSSSNDLVIGSEASDRLWIYPNPTTGVFQVRLYFGDVITENRFVSIYDQNGQVVATKEVVLTNISDPYTRIEFDLSKQAAGTYVVKVAHKHTGKITSGLVIKQ